jgi:Vacuolar protein sorting-associated protein 26
MLWHLKCAVLCAGSGSASHHEMETLAKFEIMDGAPVRGENIPIRSVS